MNISDNLTNILVELPKNTTLIAVSKTQTESDILNVYNAGHKIFGENKIQEMTKKWENLPKDIQWHMIGHVQTNKVKYMAKYVYLIHGVDNMKLINVINKQGGIHGRIIECLLQVNISNESNKYGLNESKLFEILEHLKNNDSNNDLWKSNPDRCCHLRKVKPLKKELEDFDCWISGRKSYLSGRMKKNFFGNASSPKKGII